MSGEPSSRVQVKESLKNNLDRLEKDNSRFALKQAEKDLRKLRKQYPQMTGEEKKEVSDLGKQLESLKKKK